MALQTRVPTSDTAGDWFCSAGSDYYALVDDGKGTPDDGTTYIYDDDSSHTRRLGFTAFAIDSSAIAKVTMFWRCQSNAASGVWGKSILRVDSADYFGGDFQPGETWEDHTSDFLTNPDTGSAWVEADVEGTGSDPIQEIGGRSLLGAGEHLECTSIYIEVDYTAVGVAPTAALYGPLMGPMGGPV